MPSAPVTRAGRPVRDTPAESLPEIAGGLARGLAGRRIADDAALAHPLRPHLELRLDQGEEPGPGPGKVEGRREDLRQPDETGVADHDIGRLGHQGRVQATGVHAFEGHYAGIRAQAGVKLAATDIDGEDPPGPGATRGEPAFSEDGVGSPPGGASRRGVRHGHSLSRKSA